MDCTVKRIAADTFKIEGEIEIRFTHDQMGAEPRQHFQAIRAELLRVKELSMERLIEIKNDR
jgi:hypothetical protein